LAAGIVLDRTTLDDDGAPVVSIPIAICLFFMMCPIMVKIDFAEVVAAEKSTRPVLLALFVGWFMKPSTMLAIANFFLETLLLQWIGPEAADLVRLPFGLDLQECAQYGAGHVRVRSQDTLTTTRTRLVPSSSVRRATLRTVLDSPDAVQFAS
jgi:ACR3 family arsenite transporter